MMLRFFRHIRKSLMEQNKVCTYIFYAIGEIAFVMIGILLPLQVNNWNQEISNEEIEITNDIVKTHGGILRIISQKNTGASFKIELSRH